jgi:NADH dehydrogenase (ubiquinone) 1 alpha subcomplex subunit 5
MALVASAVLRRAAVSAARSRGAVATLPSVYVQQRLFAPPVGNMPAPFPEREEPLPALPNDWQETTSAQKTTTNLTGQEPVKHAREKLYALYEETMRACDQMEEGTPYRDLVEEVTKHRMQIVFENTDIPSIEEQIGCGQIEELIDHANDELELIPEMADWKPWEVKGPRREVMMIDEERAKGYLRNMVKD